MKPAGIFFSWLAIFDSGAASIFQRYGESDVRTITGITAFMPLSANSTAALPTACAWSRSVFDARWRAERCR